jgi:hypothetical protein
MATTAIVGSSDRVQVAAPHWEREVLRVRSSECFSIGPRFAEKSKLALMVGTALLACTPLVA